MTLKTSKDETFDISWIGATNRFGSKIMIEMESDMSLPEIAACFDGVETFTKEDKKNPGVKQVFEGFSRLVSITAENADGVVRVTMAKP